MGAIVSVQSKPLILLDGASAFTHHAFAIPRVPFALDTVMRLRVQHRRWRSVSPPAAGPQLDTERASAHFVDDFEWAALVWETNGEGTCLVSQRLRRLPLRRPELRGRNSPTAVGTPAGATTNSGRRRLPPSVFSFSP